MKTGCVLVGVHEYRLKTSAVCTLEKIRGIQLLHWLLRLYIYKVQLFMLGHTHDENHSQQWCWTSVIIHTCLGLFVDVQYLRTVQPATDTWNNTKVKQNYDTVHSLYNICYTHTYRISVINVRFVRNFVEIVLWRDTELSLRFGSATGFWCLLWPSWFVL